MLSKLTLVAMLSCMALAAPGKDYGAAVAGQESAASHGSLFGGNTAGLGAGAGGDHGSLKGLAYSHVSVYRPKTHTVPIYYHHHHHAQESHGHKSHGASEAAVLDAHQGNELSEGYALQGYTHQEEAAPASGYSAGAQASYAAAPEGYSAGAQVNHAAAPVGYSAGAQVNHAAVPVEYSAGAQVNHAAAPVGYSTGAQINHAAALEGYSAGAQVNHAAAPVGYSAGTQASYAAAPVGYSAGAQVNHAAAPAGYSAGAQASYAAAPVGYNPGAQASYGAGEVSYSEGAGNPEPSYHVSAGPVSSGHSEGAQLQHFGVAERSGYEQFIPVGHGYGSRHQGNAFANHGLFRPNVQPQYHY